MYRLFIEVPEGLTFDMLTAEQKAAVASVFGQYVLPMPSTQTANGKVLMDGLAGDNFNPQAVIDLGLPFTIIGMWHSEQEEPIIPLDTEKFLAHLPDTVVYDDEGNELSRAPAHLHEPHTWAGCRSVI